MSATHTSTVMAGAVMQHRRMRGNADWYLTLFTAPMLTLVFLAITQYAGRSDLSGYAVLAPGLIALWGMCLHTAGELITRDREAGTLELLVAAPSSFSALLTGRVGVVTCMGLVGFVESWLVGWIFTGEPVAIRHPVLFAATMVLLVFAMVGTALSMAAVFVLARSARSFQNSLSYPFYLLGGVMVPVALLPEWVHPVSALVFLSWASDLLRESLTIELADDAAFSLMMLGVLGVLSYVIGNVLVRASINRLRRTGTMTYA
ncbi:hypothetical protein GCM10027403_24780 [Arthrobacter tecti]